MDDLARILRNLGYSLEESQPHMAGERRVFASHKAVLFAKRSSDGLRAVVKASNETAGIEGIEREAICRDALEKIHFAYDAFTTPQELLFSKKDGYVIQITRFIEQDMPFLERDISQQFAYALKGLKSMEGAHAATYEHSRSIRGIFPTLHSEDYLHRLSGESRELLTKHKDDVERYCGFLTHFDFMPQNIRISDGTMYLLDHSSLRFGNKHESWARFINFMVLYNPALAGALEQYVRDNRASEESLSLRLMRIYRLEELIAHHAKVAENSSENLHELSRKRVLFWEAVLESVLHEKEVPHALIEEYKRERDALRTHEEKERQKGLH